MSPGTARACGPRLVTSAAVSAASLVLVEVGDQHVGALAGEGDGHRAADAAVAAGDEGGLALELAAADVALFAEIGRRRHLRFEAGRLLGGCGKGGLRAGVAWVGHGGSCLGRWVGWGAWITRTGVLPFNWRGAARARGLRIRASDKAHGFSPGAAHAAMPPRVPRRALRSPDRQGIPGPEEGRILFLPAPAEARPAALFLPPPARLHAASRTRRFAVARHAVPPDAEPPEFSGGRHRRVGRRAGGGDPVLRADAGRRAWRSWWSCTSRPSTRAARPRSCSAPPACRCCRSPSRCRSRPTTST